MTTETRMIAADLRRHGFRVGTPCAAGVNVGLTHRRPTRCELDAAMEQAGYDACQYVARESTIATDWVVCATLA